MLSLQMLTNRENCHLSNSVCFVRLLFSNDAYCSHLVVALGDILNDSHAEIVAKRSFQR